MDFMVISKLDVADFAIYVPESNVSASEWNKGRLTVKLEKIPTILNELIKDRNAIEVATKSTSAVDVIGVQFDLQNKDRIKLFFIPNFFPTEMFLNEESVTMTASSPFHMTTMPTLDCSLK